MRYTALASLRVSLWTTMGSKVPLVPIDQEVIRKAPLFTALDDASAASLLANMVSVKIAKGSVLFAEGDEGDHL
jgi:hypothetical protein